MKLIFGILIIFSCAVRAEEIDFDCAAQAPEALHLTNLSDPASKEEFRIYECMLFGLELPLSRIIRFYPEKKINEFNLPFQQKSFDIGRIKVKEYLITSGFEGVFRFQEWQPDYDSHSDDGVWYELHYNWKGKQGSSEFVNPNYGADIDAQMLARLIELTR